MSRRKKAQVEAQINELGMETLQERLESAAQMPAQPPYRLSTLIQVSACTPPVCACEASPNLAVYLLDLSPSELC